MTDGKETGRKEVGREVTKKVVEEVVKVGVKVVASTPAPAPKPTPTPTPAPAPTPKPQPVVKTFEDVKTEAVAFKTEEREDNTLESGQTRVTQEGMNGEKTIKYHVTTTDGKETARKLLSEEVTKQPVNKVVVKGTKKEETSFDIAARNLPAGFTMGPGDEMFLGINGIYKNGRIVGEVSYYCINMYTTLSFSDQKLLAEYWVVFRSLGGRNTNKEDVMAALNAYQNNEFERKFGNIQQVGNQYILSLRYQ